MMKSLVGLSREKSVAVVDLDNGACSIAVISLPSSGASRVLAHASSRANSAEALQGSSIAALGTQLAEASQKVSKTLIESKLSRPITQVYAILRGSFVRSKHVHSEARFKEDTYIHDSIIGKLAKASLAEAKDIEPASIIEAGVLRVILNGYPSREPERKEARTIDVASIVSQCDPKERAAAESGILRAFPAAKISWRSGLRSIIKVMGSIDLEKETYLVVELGNTTTTLTVIRHGLVHGQRLVPVGTDTILAKISGNKLPEETLGSLRMLTRDACADEACEAVRAACALYEPELAKLYGEALGPLAATQHIPNDLVLVAHPDLSEWLSRFFSRIDFTQFTITTLPFSVSIITTSDVQEYVLDADAIDSSLLIGCSLVNIESREE